MLRYISILSGLAIVVLAGVFTGCAQSPIGIFESIELEREIIDDRALDNDLVVGAIAESGGKIVQLLLVHELVHFRTLVSYAGKIEQIILEVTQVFK